MRRVDDLMLLRQLADVSKKVGLRQRVQVQAGFVQQQNQCIVCLGARLDGVEPDQEAEEPDKALAALVERYRYPVPPVLDTDVQIDAGVIRRDILDVTLEIEFHV